MNSLLPTAIAIACVSLPGFAFALTDDDLAPAALAGKTLTFTIESGTAPLAASGSWTGKFETSPANGFTITKISGTTANASGTRTYIGYVGGHAYTIDPFITGQAASTLTLWISEGRPRFYVDFDKTGMSTQFGGFVIGGSTANAPEINVLNEGKKLTDGTAKVSFGVVKLGKSLTEKFVIKNTGKAKLTSLAVTKNGTNKSEFGVGALPKTSLAPGASMTLNVTFKPGSKGQKSAAIHIKSNDADESPFDIKLAGEGVK